MVDKKAIMLGLVLILPFAFLGMTFLKAEGNSEKPIIVCTTNVVGSIVQEIVGDLAHVVVLVQPSLCPADFDMKPSDVYAVSKAKVLFKQNIPGEFWLQSLLEAAGNKNLTQVIVSGVYNTPEGAKNYIQLVGGNLSRILGVNFDAKISEMLGEVDSVHNWIKSQAQALHVSSVKVICMNWLKTFVESVGFTVVATYNPPETLSAADIDNLIKTARNEGVALIIDNLQIDVEFGRGIASQVGAEHVILTNFPGAIPGTESLARMLRFNAGQLFNATITWRATANLKAEMESLENQVSILQITTIVAVTIAIVEAVLLYAERSRH
ncbi:MAG: metal ABC transporter substrate-binding protein [Nitrososphaerota archaeon]|nr:metal ABC transporter substrate-binding protein [Candidatus Bathyarchaeota archaeon]MDW8048562.1 metal ABC transporter substrate-binding protein [Nitrososphaerota archaeon]